MLTFFFLWECARLATPSSLGARLNITPGQIYGRVRSALSKINAVLWRFEYHLCFRKLALETDDLEVWIVLC